MKVVIPYRLDSTRLPRKNLKEFHDGKSLLDLTIEQFDGHEIVLASVMCDESLKIAKKHNAKQLFLPDGDPGWPETVEDMGQKLEVEYGADEPVLVWFATELTFFISHTADEFISHGLTAFRQRFDSTILCRKFKHFLLDHNFLPENFSYGSWFGYSQGIEPKYWVIPGVGMTTPATMIKHRSVNGPYYKPFVANQLYTDIDEQFEFQLAQTMWKQKDAELRNNI